MRLVIYLTLAILACSSAHAEVNFRKDPDAKTDLALIEGCLAEAETWETARECVNITYKDCVGRIEGNVSRAHQSACNYRELDLWFHLYSLEAMRIEAWTILKDQQVRATGDNPVHAHKTYQRSEETWRKYIASQCDLEMIHWDAGTIRTTSEPHCLMRLVAEHMIRLRKLTNLKLPEMQP